AGDSIRQSVSRVLRSWSASMRPISPLAASADNRMAAAIANQADTVTAASCRSPSTGAGERPQAFFLCPQLRRGGVTEVLDPHHWPDLHFRAGSEGRTLAPFGRLVERADLPQPVAGQQFAGFGERAVRHRVALVAIETHAAAARAGVQAFAGQ